MKTYFKALIKSLFGDMANTAAVVAAVAVAMLLGALGKPDVAGWALSAVLLLAMAWLAGRYGRPKH